MEDQIVSNSDAATHRYRRRSRGGSRRAQAVSMMFDAARLMAAEARGENERALFGQDALNERYRQLDAREVRLDERDRRVTIRERSAELHDHIAARREAQTDIREQEQMEHDVREQREDT